MKVKYNRICPYGKKYLDSLIRNCIYEVFLFSIAAITAVVLWNVILRTDSVLYLMESLCFSVYLVMTEVPNYKLLEKENSLYRELLIYFSRVKHRYTAGHHIANAVLEAGLDMSYEVQRLSDELYRVLMECDRKENIREYSLNHHSNRYLKLFLIQAYEASEKGDVVEEDGTSLFSENVEHLRLELMEELYRRKKRAHEFAGYTFVAVTPVFMMPVLKQWGLDFAPELAFFYAGMGVLLESLTFLVTVLIYKMIGRAKEIAFFTEQEPEIKTVWDRVYKNRISRIIIRKAEQSDGRIAGKVRRLLLLSGERISFGKFCVQILLITVGCLLLLCSFQSMIHVRERQSVLGKVERMDEIAPVAGDEKKQILEQYILEITEQLKKKDDVTEEEIRLLLRLKMRIGSDAMENEAVAEIQNKIIRYQSARWTLTECLLCILLSITAGTIPIWRVYYQIRMIANGAVHEVRLFQSVLIMERKIQGITIVGMLEDMEIFSKGYREILRRCINSYGAGSEEALLKLKEEGKKLHEGFEELADAFLSVDEIGIALAFQEVENNRRLLEKMTRLEAEINLEKKKDLTDLLAKIPVLLAVGIYFIIPFFVYALQGVYEVFELMEGMRT